MNTEEVKIAHLSDLHISGRKDHRQLEDLDRMFDCINRTGADHLVISGDLSDKANSGDWAIVKEKLEKHGLYHFEKTTVIAGNHDLINLEEEMRFYNALNPLPQLRKKTFNRKIGNFCRYFRELITGEDGASPLFPFVKIINYPSIKIAFTAFNSVYPWYPADNPLGARGVVDQEQLQAFTGESLLSTLRECFVIGLCHHAYKVYGTDSLIDQAFDWTMELKNREEFLDLMTILNARVVLHGHFHRFQSYKVKDVTFVNGGSFRCTPGEYSELVINGDGEFRQRFVMLD
ncbi:MAG: metallophosphoesterase [Chlorobiaceae bacterium]|nr:metallophosphoesterase [Chlorobiaceae bacterium]